MRRLATRAVAALLVSGLGLGLSHCSSDAKGIEACQRIESRRCELAVGCPEFPAVTDDADIIECKQVYRDQCDFGIAQGQDPDELAIELCLQALEEANLCRDQDLASCPDAPLLNQLMLNTGGDGILLPGEVPVDPALIHGCSVIHRPEFLAACSFLAPFPDVVLPGTGGAGGTTAATGGAGGGGGA